MTNAAIKQLIAQGVVDALAEIDAIKTSRNGDDNHDSRTSSRRTERTAHECTYIDFLKCKPLNFKDQVCYLHSSWQCSDVVEFPLKTVGHDITYGIMFLEESDEVKKYVDGLPDMIQGSVMASKPKTMQDAIEIAIDLMDQKIPTFAERQAENKRKLDNNNQA
ncbi:hypothetical protein Tco_1088093 [Tanacetum coccineum]